MHFSLPHIKFLKGKKKKPSFIWPYSCGLSCGTWDLSLQHTDFLTVSLGQPLEHAGLVAPLHVGS